MGKFSLRKINLPDYLNMCIEPNTAYTDSDYLGEPSQTLVGKLTKSCVYRHSNAEVLKNGELAVQTVCSCREGRI